MVVGDDFRYGRNREGTIATLRDAGDAPRVHGRAGARRSWSTASASAVRSCARRSARGDLDRAAALLGRPYRMTGRVRRGAQLGRTLGYPTANLALHRKVDPAVGHPRRARERAGLRRSPGGRRASARARRSTASSRCSRSTCSISAGDLYGQYLSVDFVRWLRAERKFESLDALVEQMNCDARQARAGVDQVRGAPVLSRCCSAGLNR